MDAFSRRPGVHPAGLLVCQPVHAAPAHRAQSTPPRPPVHAAAHLRGLLALAEDVDQLLHLGAPIDALLAAWRARGWPVLHTRECHRPDLSDCPPAKRERGEPALRIGDPGPMGRLLVAGEPGADIIPALAPAPGEWVVDKPGKGMFWATCAPEGLHARLQAAGITHLLFTGVTTEVCVQTSMREANDRGYTCLIVEDATDSYFPAFKRAALEMIVAQGGIVGWCAPSAAVLAALPAD